MTLLIVGLLENMGLRIGAGEFNECARRGGKDTRFGQKGGIFVVVGVGVGGGGDEIGAEEVKSQRKPKKPFVVSEKVRLFMGSSMLVLQKLHPHIETSVLLGPFYLLLWRLHYNRLFISFKPNKD